jgi:hypothetical protein
MSTVTLCNNVAGTKISHAAAIFSEETCNKTNQPEKIMRGYNYASCEFDHHLRGRNPHFLKPCHTTTEPDFYTAFFHVLQKYSLLTISHLTSRMFHSVSKCALLLMKANDLKICGCELS